MTDLKENISLEIKKELARLERYIEHDINVRANIKALWELCTENSIEYEYLMDFIRKIAVEPEKVIQKLVNSLKSTEEVDDSRIAFITCVNNEDEYNESLEYLKALYVPSGMTVEYLAVREAPSMCAGYEYARKSSNAKYKVYLHQDVMILNKTLIFDLLRLFKENPDAGMIGLAGCGKLSSSGYWWEGEQGVSCVAYTSDPERLVVPMKYYPQNVVADAVDGVFMAFSQDIPWRADLFDGWHFYDISASREVYRAGYKVIIPAFSAPWCIHVEKPKVLGDDYYRYRDIFLREYMNC